MKKFINAWLLFTVIFIGAISITAEASQLDSTKTSSSSHSKKSRHTTTKKPLVQSHQVELENGMRIVKYSLDRPIDNNGNYGFMYSIEWPVSGPEPLTTECRDYIASIIDIDKTKINNDGSSIIYFIEAKYKDYQNFKSEEFPNGEGWLLDYQNVTVSADNKKTIINIFSDQWGSHANGSIHGEYHNKMFLNNGKAFDFSMLPPEEVMMPLILKYLCEFGTPVEDTIEYRYLGYPKEAPVIKDGYMEFDYGFYDGPMYITSPVPVSEIIPFASPELLEFLE